MPPRRWLRELAAGERCRLRLAVLCGAIAGALTVAQLALLAWLVAGLLGAEGGRVPGDLIDAFLGLLALVGARALAQWGQETLGLEASLRIRRRARGELLDHLERLGPAFLTSRHSASLAHQLVEQVEALDGYFARFQPQLWLAVLVPGLVLAVVLFLDWLAALFLLLAAPLIPLFMALVGMGAERLNRDQFAAVARLSGHFIDRVRGLTTLQLFGRTREATAEVHVAADHYRRLSMRTLRLAFLSSAVLEFFSAVAIAVVAIYVGFGLLGYIGFGPSPQLSLFSGLLVLLLAPEFFQPLRSLSQHYHDRAAALGAAEGLVALLEEVPAAGRAPAAGGGKAPAAGGGKAPAAGSGKESSAAGRGSGDETSSPAAGGALVTLRGACVAYRGRGRVLGPLDLTIVPGEVLAVTGPSGAGKSTLLQLLAGFVGPERGERRIAPGLRIAWLDQRPLLTQGSLADNLRLAAPEADDAALETALGRAGLGELLAALPDGLATPLGERGVGLSGGQAQRLALARVFLSPAPLVLLDEPTASLDEASEARVVAALRELAAEGRSLVIATHHPALMALADRRLVLADSREAREDDREMIDA